MTQGDLIEEAGCFLPREEPEKTYTTNLEELGACHANAKSDDGRTNVHKPYKCSQSKAPKNFRQFRQSKRFTNAPQVSTHSTSTDPLLLEYRDLSNLGVEKSLDRFGTLEDHDRFCFFSSKSWSTIHAVELGGLVEVRTTFRDLFELGPEGGVWWLDIKNPTDEEYAAISRAFNFHSFTTEDIMNQEACEKIESCSHYYFVCFRTLNMRQESNEPLEAGSTYIVVFPQGVVSLSFSDNPHSSNVQKRIGKLRDRVALGSDWICYAMIGDIIETFDLAVRDTEYKLEAIENQILLARKDDLAPLLRQIEETLKRIQKIMLLLDGKADVLQEFAKLCNELYSVNTGGDITLSVSDTQDHLATMMLNLENAEDILSRHHSNCLAQLNVDCLTRGNHGYKVITKISLVALIFISLQLIVVYRWV